ncbi:NAD(P)H-dependent oxidoreductase [Brumimicrobium glaciale]|uniref:NAD(P)H-dependent oxidoreductase n=1 Tax=Brumimicrobium glaciale TaxID=200475 RepID=A0A4Q4KMY6_9FLAO|nr:NADPH-dependent FMN reductase [Brumimicrobium glaciale]RYM34793.1 NAD(P)H-dependent oxidoreductase [Brumimicrobium glaciale]
MKILAISGSASIKSSNYYLLKAIQTLFKDRFEITIYDSLSEFPLFTPQRLKEGIPEIVQDFKGQLFKADAVVISTPEYTHNIPAVLKNMIEWCTHSGEFTDKKVLPITFTPYEPRGENAMKSLLFSLSALDAKPIVQLPIYKTDVTIGDEVILLSDDVKELIESAFELF